MFYSTSTGRFEKNRPMNDQNKLALPITLTMMDGRTLMGDLMVNIGGTIERTLNSEMRFIVFRDLDQSQRFIAKDGILDAQERKTAKVVDLPTEGKMDGTDPYTVLKIARTATDSEIREAYLARAKSYHADRFANIDLPLEVQEYTNSMSRRINEAYAILNAGKTQRMQQPDQTVYGQAG